MKPSLWDRIAHGTPFPRWLSAPLIFGQHAAVVEFLVRYYCHNRCKVLDIGARRSPYTKDLKGLVVGLDLPTADDANLGFNLPNLNQFTDRHNLAVFGNGEDLPFKPKTFDAVLMIEVIEHIDRDRKALEEIFGVLKPGGILVLSTPNGGTFPIPSTHHKRHYKPEVLKILIENFFKLKLFWCLFPKGRFWHESIKSVKSMVHNREVISIAKHIAMIWIYWVFTAYWFLGCKTKNTTTIFIVAEKKAI